jgi:hypothetical protein
VNNTSQKTVENSVIRKYLPLESSRFDHSVLLLKITMNTANSAAAMIG